MKWSLWIGKYFGIDVYLHVTFLLLLGFIGLVDRAGMTGFFVLVLALFGCVLLHEFGHALMARRFGIPTRDITLLPIGGVARLEKMPDSPWEEFLVAIAGPAVNVVIAALLLPVVLLGGGIGPDFFTTPGITGSSFSEALLKVNLSLIAFNLLPAFPMDGGRVLRALLAMKMDHAKATNIAARVGQGMAVLFGVIALYSGQLVLGLIAFFVWSGAARENRYTQMRSVFRGVTAGHAMQPAFGWLEPNDTLSRAVHVHQNFPQAAYPVLHDGHPVGLVLPEDLVAAVSTHYLTSPVAPVMRSGDMLVVSADDPLEEVMMQMQTHETPIALVERNGVMAGILTAVNIAGYFEIHGAMARFQPAGSTSPAGAPPPLPDHVHPA
jgi:Zn-dependent protease/predicted transcriptional regulator